jgi:hypothetical protein
VMLISFPMYSYSVGCVMTRQIMQSATRCTAAVHMMLWCAFMMKYMLALEVLEAVARANEAVAEQIFKALETLHKAQEQLQHDVNETRKSD